MISIETMDGTLVKVLNNVSDTKFGLHQLFGFTSESKAKQREELRTRQGFEFHQDKWHCGFKLSTKNGLTISGMQDCKAVKLEDDAWKLMTPIGDFKLHQSKAAVLPETSVSIFDESRWLNKITEIILFSIFLIIPIIYFMLPSSIDEVEEKKKEVEKITVKVVKQVNAVNIAKKKSSIKVKPLTKSQKSRRAVKRNLGFLGLVGSKSATKAVGGVPQNLKQVTAGAGAGGDAGSGGEVLTNLGKGLKKTTVGNTGVAGLGGIGTKGAGGGAGGYGNTMVASGEGSGITSISVGSRDMVLEGGIGRYAINATIAKYLSQVRRCYENQLNKTPGIEGLVTVAFQINGQGRLNFANVKKSSLGSKAVEKCITTKMMGWQFPKPKGGVNTDVSYPFMLRPVGT